MITCFTLKISKHGVSLCYNLHLVIMKDKEIKDLVKKLEKYRKELSMSEEKSRKFLVQTGIITEKGNLRKPYRNLCIPQEQA